jgi:hypothetical protein
VDLSAIALPLEETVPELFSRFRGSFRMIFQIEIHLEWCGASYAGDISRPLEHSLVVGYDQPDVSTAGIFAETKLSSQPVIRRFMQKECNKAEPNEAGKERGCAQAGGRIFDAGIPEFAVKVLSKFLAGAGSHVTANNIVPKELILGPPGVQKEIWVTQGNDIVAARTDFRLGYHSVDKTLCLESTYYAAGKAGIHIGFSRKSADRVGAVPMSKQVTRDARTLGGENVCQPPALLEQVGAALNVNLSVRA